MQINKELHLIDVGSDYTVEPTIITPEIVGDKIFTPFDDILIVGDHVATVTAKKYPVRSVLKFTTRSAKPGEPSVLWISKTGKFYRTIVDAKIDNPTKSIVYNSESGYVSFPAGTTNAATETKNTPDVNTTPTTSAVVTKKTHTVVYLVLFVVVIVIVYKLIKL